jgi:hypothetical protein
MTMAKKTKKLAVKKETLRQLDALTSDQLRAAAGGGYAILLYTGLCINQDTLICAGILTGGGVKTFSCDTRCETDGGYTLL